MNSNFTPGRIEVMQPTLARLPFSNPDWLFEPKWDGYRAVCFFEDGAVHFISRTQKSLTKRFPQLQGIARLIKASSAILDGEIVALDVNGVPCFSGMSGKSECEIVYYAFDLLKLNDRDLTQSSLLERKSALKKILPKRGTGRIRYTDHVIGKGEQLFLELEKQKLEGMVAKRTDSLYVGGRTKAWLKIKTTAGREEMRKRSETWGHR